VVRDGVFINGVAAAPVPPTPPAAPIPIAGGRVEFRPAGAAGGQDLMWAMADVAVSGQDIENIQLSLQPAMKIAGRIVFEPGATPPPADLSRTAVSLQPVAPLPFNSSVPRGVVQPDGSFSMNGLLPGKYRLMATSPSSGQPSAWALKSVSVGGVEVLDTAIDLVRDDLTDARIVFTDRISSFSGTIVDGNDKPVADINVLMFSTDRTFWTQNSRRVLTRRSTPEGNFTFFNLPPGEYYVITMTDLTQNDWQAPSMLEQLALVAFKITIAEGQNLKQALRLAGG
jgi:hypothetical protein